MFTRGEISCPGELSLTTIFPSKKIHNKASSQQVKFVMIRIEFIFSRFKSILLGASGEGFRKQTKEGKSLFTLRGLVSCDANETSFELPLKISLAHVIMLACQRCNQMLPTLVFVAPALHPIIYFAFNSEYRTGLTHAWKNLSCNQTPEQVSKARNLIIKLFACNVK